MKRNLTLSALVAVCISCLLHPLSLSAQNINYMGLADSCMKLKDYPCAAANYDLALEKMDPESNGIAFMAARAWALTNDKEKTWNALNRYVKNNGLNNNIFFSDQLLKERAFDFLKDDARWTAMIAAVKEGENQERAREKKSLDSVKAASKVFESAMDVRPQLKTLSTTPGLYTQLKTLLVYPSPKPYVKDNGVTLYLRVDTTEAPFYVHLPDNYNPAVPSPAMVILHGAVRFTTGYGDGRYVYRATSDHIPFYSKNYIAIYPMGTKTINWMTTEGGFDMVNRIVIYLKAFLNIDDNRVELLGHSNGATGVFTYLVKSPTLYAGFYGMDTQPRVYIGGTFLQNGMTRHFYNFATDKDYYYPYAAVKTIDSLAKSLGVTWYTQLNVGYPHWFPSMKEAFTPMAKIFADMANRVRNPYPGSIYFETDDVKYGTSDWITITKLDTLSKKTAWQTDPNFKITDWPDKSDFNKIVHHEEMAFDYPHKSGAVKAKRQGNDFYIQTSDVAGLCIRLNREMIDYNKKVTVFVNGKKVFSQRIKPDGAFTLANFKMNLDRNVIWENEISIAVH
jgi:pimeloyl-ACP methyl ester carboxylesterase